MNSTLEKILVTIINSISSMMFDASSSMLASIDHFLNSDILTLPYTILFYISVNFVFIILTIRSVQFMKYGFSREQVEKILVNIFILIIICTTQKHIMNFTFNYWNSYLNEAQVVDVLKQGTNNSTNIGLTTSIIGICSAMSALTIAISQMIEVTSLQLVLILSPIVLIGSFFNNNIVGIFLKIIYKGIFSPVVQTMIMYISVKVILPIHINIGIVSPITTLILIYGSYTLSKIIVDSIDHKDTYITTKINMVKTNQATSTAMNSECV